MGGKTKTFFIILGMIGVYFIALNVILSTKMADLNPGAVRGAPSDYEDSGKPTSGSQGGLTGELAVGNVVTFGSYEQDADFSNGKEPLSNWIMEKNRKWLNSTMRAASRNLSPI